MPTDRTDVHGGSLSKPQGPPPSSSHSSEGSPSSLIMARGRSRVRRVSSDADPFSEENLRKRCVSGRTTFYFHSGWFRTSFCPRSGYHSLKSFDQTFHLEKRWKLVREMGSGAYGVVMLVRIPSPLSLLSPPLFLRFPSVPPFYYYFKLISISILINTRLSSAQLQTRSRERLWR